MNNCDSLFNKPFFFLCDDCNVEEKPNIELLSNKKIFKNKSENTSLLFLFEGKAEVSYGKSTRLIEQAYFFLIPANEYYTIHSTENTKIVVFGLDEKLLVQHKRKKGLLYDIYNMKPSEIANFETAFGHNQLLVIKTNRHIKAILDNCIAMIENGFVCSRYMQCKTEELLIQLRNYYSDKLLACLFQPAFNNRIDIDLVIKKNHGMFYTVEEYAVTANLNRNIFRRKFKELYGINPTEWIKQERVNQVLQDLMENKKTISEIISEYKFSSFPNFIRFCKKHYKNTPGNIQKSQKTQIEK